MPLAAPTTIESMDEAVQNIINNLPADAAGLAAWNCAEAWSKVATEFFSAAAIPSVSALGIAAGELAFTSACQAAEGATDRVSAGSLASGFSAYAGAIVAPTMCSPPPPVVHAPPPGTPVISMSTPSESTLPSTTALHGQLLTWALTGTQTTPGAPPVIVPWL